MNKISVIIPTYKPLDYIFDCLDSLRQQELSKDRFEVIVVLNGEREPYFSQISNYISNDVTTTIHLIYTEKKGVSNARNEGLNFSRFNLISFIDDDDWVSKNYLSDLLDKYNQSNEFSIIVSNFKISNNDKIGSDYISKAYQRLKYDRFTIFSFRKFLSVVHGKLIPKSVINNVYFNVNLALAEDSLFMFEISSRLKDIKLSNDDCIYYRRIRNQSATRKTKSTSKTIHEYWMKIKFFSLVYLKNIFKLNFFFFITRIIAINKVLFLQILKKCKDRQSNGVK
jgi:glycosyltransferase involved in cell wall biosynthesis